jgi:TonB family protein
MSSILKLIVGLALIVSCLTLGANAQTAELKHFSVDGLSFDYPAAYSLADESTAETQKLKLTGRGGSVQFTIVAPRRFVRRSELSTALENTKEPLLKEVATKLGQNTNTASPTSIKIDVGPVEADGVRLRSSVRPSRSGDVIWVRLKFRVLSLAYVRSDADESIGSKTWQTIRSSLGVEAPVIAAKQTEDSSEDQKIEGGVLNGTAVSLPRPVYPPIAHAAHASGTVVVQVVIDEQGNVISAHAIAGHPLLQSVAVAAAQQAKFSPTLLEGEPVRVTGVITYNFVF